MEKAKYLTPVIKAMIGREDSFTSREEIGLATIKRFAKAIGDPNPLYCDEEYARESRFKEIIAPPTLIFELNHNLGGDVAEEDGGYTDKVSLPPPFDMVIRGGNEYEFLRPCRVSDRITTRRKIAQIYEKKGKRSPLIFVICEISYFNQRGEVLAINRETLIFISSKGASE